MFAMNEAKSPCRMVAGPRLWLGSGLLGVATLLSGCSSPPPSVISTTTERTSTQQYVPVAPSPLPTSVTTTRTQQYTP
jgi:starvation-inducible outer membrane lipoprotein